MRPVDKLIPDVINMARAAGRAILDVYATDFAVENKSDATPVTRADLAAQEIIVAALRKLTPDIPLISEEASLASFQERSAWPAYWLIDPLDGTREFVDRNGEFTVNIALIERHAPRLGVVHVPLSDTTYTGHHRGAAKIRGDGNAQRIRVVHASQRPVRVIASRSHRGGSIDEWLGHLGDYELIECGSSLKFCRLAEGAADVYPRLGPTSEWDTAAGQAVLEAAGGRVLTPHACPLAYNTKAEILNGHFVASGPADRDWLAHLS